MTSFGSATPAESDKIRSRVKYDMFSKVYHFIGSPSFSLFTGISAVDVFIVHGDTCIDFKHSYEKKKNAPVSRRHDKVKRYMDEMYPMNAFGHRQLCAAFVTRPVLSPLNAVVTFYFSFVVIFFSFFFWLELLVTEQKLFTI